MNAKLYSIYTEYQVDADFLSVLRYRTDLTTKMFKLVMSVYVTSVIIIVLYPLIYGIFFGEKHLIMQFMLPGVDSSASSGYLIHNSVHTFLIILGAFGNFATDMYIFIFITHIPLLKDILKIKCEHLNKLIHMKNNEKKTMSMLKEIVNWHQNYNT